MFSYRTKEGKEVILIRDKCRCINKRIHIFTARVNKYFCVSENIGWYQGLKTTAFITICYGTIHFFFYHIIIFRSTPAGIHSFLLFPWISFMHFFEAITLILNGVFLYRGVKQGNLQKIRNYPWVLLSSYIFAASHVWNTIWQGPRLAMALGVSDFGMDIKPAAEEDWSIVKSEKFCLYIFLVILVLVDLSLPTYLIILSLSLIDKLEYEMENECFAV